MSTTTNDGDVRVSSRRVWTTAGNATTTVEQSRQVAAVDGSESTSFAAGQFAGSASRIHDVPQSLYGTLSTNADGTQVVMLRQHGRQVSVTTLAKPAAGQSAGDLLSVVEYGYDAFGRPATTRDTRLTDTVLTDDRTTTVAYDAADRVVGSTISGPSGSQTTTLHLDNLGRVYQTDKPDGSSVFTVVRQPPVRSRRSWGSGGVGE
jgi:YD repeat-containing protein